MTTGLFGKPPTGGSGGGGGLFGGGGGQTGGGGGLFTKTGGQQGGQQQGGQQQGGQQQQQQQQGQQQQQQQKPSLFGNKPAGQTQQEAPKTGGGLFASSGGGGQQQQQQQGGQAGQTQTGGTTGTQGQEQKKDLFSGGNKPAGGGLFSNTAGGGGTTGGTGTLGAGGQAAQQKAPDIDTSMRNNMTVHAFHDMAKQLTQHEQEAARNMQNSEQLNGIIDEMNREYKSIEIALDGIEKGQNDLYYKLDAVETDLSNYLYPTQTPENQPRSNLISMAQRLNTEIYQIEQDLSTLVTDMNQPIGDKDSTQLSENILNNYFDALQWLENETLKTMNKLAKVENLMSSKLYE